MKIIPRLSIFAITGIAAFSQIPAPRTSGPGVQATADARYPEAIKSCKTPPPAGRGGAFKGKGGAPKGAAKGPAPSGPRDYTVTAIPGVIAAGAKWTEVWTVDGNNADGIIADKDGNILVAQNDNSQIIKLEPNGKTSVAFKDLNTSGSLARNSKNAIFVLNRGLNPTIEQLSPKRQKLADSFNGDPLHCTGGVLNDMTADSKGGVYFTNGVVYYADPKGNVTRYGENLGTNGIVLSADEKHLFVTNGPTLAEFDVQPDGSLTNQREFVRWEGGGGDGSTFDSEGRFYVTAGQGIQVISADGKVLGMIPIPQGAPITVTFGGKDRKMLYVVTRDNAQNKDWIIGIPMLAQGSKTRGK